MRQNQINVLWMAITTCLQFSTAQATPLSPAKVEGTYALQVNSIASPAAVRSQYPSLEKMVVLQTEGPRGIVVSFVESGAGAAYLFDQCIFNSKENILESPHQKSKRASHALSRFRVQFDDKLGRAWGWIEDADSRGTLYIDAHPQKLATLAQQSKDKTLNSFSTLKAQLLFGEYQGTLISRDQTRIRGLLVVRKGLGPSDLSLTASFIEDHGGSNGLKLSFAEGHANADGTIGLVNSTDNDNPIRLTLAAYKNPQGKVVLTGLLISAGYGAVSEAQFTFDRALDEPAYP